MFVVKKKWKIMYIYADFFNDSKVFFTINLVENHWYNLLHLYIVYICILMKQLRMFISSHQSWACHTLPWLNEMKYFLFLIKISQPQQNFLRLKWKKERRMGF
jgi:hypothetical protein